jgi:phage terminase large subunit
MSFIRTTAINKILNLKKRIKIIQGGTSAGKTYGILPILIDKASKKAGLEISVVSESIPHLRRGALKDFIKIMQETNRWIAPNYNKSFLKYTFANGSYIEFFSVEQPDKLRGARRNILYVNEANNIPFEAYQQLSIRTSDEVYLDYNPTHEFYAHTELIPDNDSDFIILTYKDNEGLSDSIVKEIEKAKDKGLTSKYWANWWNVYGLGLVGSLEGVVFQNWEQIRAVPGNAKILGYGMDFGYTNDPTTLIACYKLDNELIFDEVIYRTGLLNSDIKDLMNNHNVGHNVVYADSAEPKSIAELKRYGFYIKPTDKGRDSINYGINILQQYNFKVTKRSTNLIKELRSYTWDTSKTGERLNKPIDAFNHGIDAMRYFAMMKLNTNNGNYDIR